MSSAALPIAVPRGAYPEREHPRLGWLDRMGERAAGLVARGLLARSRRWARIAELAGAEGAWAGRLSDTDIRAAAAALRPQLRRQGFRDELVARVFALVREAAGRGIGQRHFDVQLIGGWVLLGGLVAEMETGEGKTLTATLPACAAALAGIPVHIVTVNDYLAARDAEWMAPIYRALGLTVGTIVHGLDLEARRAAYGCDVTYCTNKEVAFDYLRDRIVLGRRGGRIQIHLDRLAGRDTAAGQLRLRGLWFGIVDEADSVLVDEARTPLIISGAPPAVAAAERDVYRAALTMVERLAPDRDYTIDARERSVRLTDAGRAHLAELAAPLGGVWSGRLRREELVRQAVTARHLFVRDKHYLVQEDKVQIIDEYTGRLMPDRSWEHGLHQLIEAKESCPPTGLHDPLARISYQRFFRRYLRLAGMTGTAREVAGELWSVYRLAVVRVSTNRPIRRRGLGGRVEKTAGAKWDAVAERAAEAHRAGRPVLVGTTSVGASEHLSRRLSALGLPHRVLNARQDREEAETIAQAGAPGQITVATNMAGRGTDIRLAPGVAERGGLHVILTERHDARRIDRQLFGRCGRQGDPGTHEAIVSLEDELLAVYGGWAGRWLGRAARRAPAALGTLIGGLAFRRAQRAAERRNARARRDLVRVDEQLETTLAFSGGLE